MKHSIDFIFPIILFFVFATTSLSVLLFSADTYQNDVNTSNYSFETSTTLAYITEKIRQNDTSDTQNISICQFQGHDALTISQYYNDVLYHTYIYETDGKLKELFIQDGVSASAEFGTTILPIHSLNMTELSDNLFQFTCTAEDGTSDSVILSVQSQMPQ